MTKDLAHKRKPKSEEFDEMTKDLAHKGNQSPKSSITGFFLTQTGGQSHEAAL